MILKRLYDDGLAHASYLIGCPAAGECVIVDPNRDFTKYLRAASSEYLRITAVTETHIHADYLSGARELAQITGARLYLSGEGGSDWQYDFASADGAQLLKDGDTFAVGGIEFKAVHTPGHTPEHISFVVTDRSTAEVPVGALTGDFVFVGDVGRPDLLERAAKQAGTMEAGAKSLYSSLTKFRSLLPDYAMLFPAHGSGSACGKALGGVPVTTIGYEKASNWAFQKGDENSFVSEVLTGQPDPPAYFAVMKKWNKAGPAFLGEVRPLPEFDADVLPQIRTDTIVVDVRDSDDFSERHVPGSMNVPALSKGFCTYAGSVLPFDRPLSIIADSREQAEYSAHRLRLIGLDDVRGWLQPTEITDGASLQQVDVADAFKAVQEGGATLLDVRNTSEYESCHVPGATLIPLGRLAERVGEIDRSKPIAVHCESGMRSVVACSLLERLGFASVANIRGGFCEYMERGFPVVEGEHG